MGRADHIVVCGHDGLAARVVEELRGLGEEVVLVSPSQAETLPGLRDVERVTGGSADEEALRAAGVPEAAAVALLEDNDVGNLHAALAVQDLAPHTRLVVRFFNLKLGRRLEALFPDAHLLSPAEIAAPAFAEAALSGNTGAPIEVHGHVLELRESDVSDPALVAPVALPEAASS